MWDRGMVRCSCEILRSVMGILAFLHLKVPGMEWEQFYNYWLEHLKYPSFLVKIGRKNITIIDDQPPRSSLIKNLNMTNH